MGSRDLGQSGEHEWSPTVARYPGFSDSSYAEQRVIDRLRRDRDGGSQTGSGERVPDRGPYYGKGPKGYRRSDERIREEVCDAIARQGFIDASDVEVFVEGGVVRFAGTVSRSEDKRALELITERLLGVVAVRSELSPRKGERTRTQS